jgi:hypothetical protein
MANIFARQNRYGELSDLWKAPPDNLKAVLDLHKQDVRMLMTKMLLESKNWPLVEENSLTSIEQMLKVATEDGSKSEILELCGRRWDLWSALLGALHATRTKEECVPYPRQPS